MARMPYCDIYSRCSWGSGGGTSGLRKGGRGGGFAHLDLIADMTIYGEIRANGDNGLVSRLTMIYIRLCPLTFRHSRPVIKDTP